MKKYAFAGTSDRALYMYAKRMIDDFKDYCEIVGVYDINPKRAACFSKDVGNPTVYEDFDTMIKTEKPDTVIVTTVDAFHHQYIIRSLQLGCDVITEKPMTIDSTKCEEILEAEQKSGKKVTVTFNYRYIPYNTEIKKMIKSGELGDILSVDFEWMLDRNMSFGAHGSSYFRRWNRYLKSFPMIMTDLL